MTNTTQKIGAGILATAIVSAIALTSATHASTIDQSLDISDADLTAFEQELASLTDQEIQEIEAYVEANKTDEEKTEEAIDATISEDDWNTLSMKAIDDKLVAAGLEKIGDEENDPHYNKTPAEIAQTVKNISASDWADIEADMNNIDTEK